MPITSAPKIVQLSQATDPKAAIKKAVGDLSGLEVMFNQVLVATYFRPEKTSGGIIRPTSNVEEDRFQGKVGLVIKVGPTAFKDDEIDYAGQTVEVGDWVAYRVGDGWEMTLNGTPCRLISDLNIRLKVSDPELIF